MATIVTRSGKGSPLTNTEVDNNFTNLNTDKLENITGESIGDLSDVNTMTPTDGQLLTWDNTNSRWDAADAPVSLPDQTGSDGYFLTTDGSSASWAEISTGVEPIVYNLDTVSSALTISSGRNGFSVGDVTISSGGSVTIADGQKWLVADGNLTSNTDTLATTGKAIAMAIVFGG